MKSWSWVRAWPAYAPRAGMSLLGSTPMLAVGKRSRRPTLSPERRPVSDWERGDEVLVVGAGVAGVRAEGRDELVGLDPDVGGGKAQPPPHLVPRLDRAGHRVFAAQEAVGLVDIARVDQAPDLRAVGRLAFEGEGRHHVDLVTG